MIRKFIIGKSVGFILTYYEQFKFEIKNKMSSIITPKLVTT